LFLNQKKFLLINNYEKILDNNKSKTTKKQTSIFSNRKKDEDGNETTTITETTTDKDIVRTNTINSNGETIYNATFVSEPKEISSNNEGEEIKLYEASSLGTPKKNQSNTFSNSKTDITTTTITTNESGKSEIKVKVVKISIPLKVLKAAANVRDFISSITFITIIIFILCYFIIIKFYHTINKGIISNNNLK